MQGYTHVRLVFAPEFDAAFFGGDPDNFTYPRYDLDISFFRIYENGKPVHLDHYLGWSATGVKENDLILVSGHPDSTGRLLTVSQLEFLRDLDYPTGLEIYSKMDTVLRSFSSQSEENARIAKEDIFGIENNIKRFIGYPEGLHDRQTMGRKAADEQKLEATYKANAKNGGTPDPWQVSLHSAVDAPFRMTAYCLITVARCAKRSGLESVRARSSQEAKRGNHPNSS
ncbi:MAG: hypothetical protein DMG70_14865 [Acidobacteria bacterium]|nr:MAG: hypothetical protein DMG70_14865 [Acidobacteriota bacterium]